MTDLPEARTAASNGGVTWKQAAADIMAERVTLAVLVTASVGLIVVRYFPSPSWFVALWSTALSPLARFVWWLASQVVMWVLVPYAVARTLGVRKLGLGISGLWSKLWLYGILYAGSAVVIVSAATQAGFQATYPFLRPEMVPHWSWKYLLAFWLLYAAQFFCVEFFFRGFLIFSLKDRIGLAAIPVMVVPYVMIHFGKPLPETVSAVFGGLVLGWLAYRTESIWGGVVLHIMIALTMDVASMAFGVGFPVSW
ncbi:MAG: CPBP family intramembrane metalloprotease [Gemmatimonadota bacterium]|nr:CPBP family intramembrane metalloprotease [Gemmatimonadota bacterium]